jgi:hypothetical protein
MTNLSEQPPKISKQSNLKPEKSGSLSLMHQIGQKNYAQKSMLGGKLLKFKSESDCLSGK